MEICVSFLIYWKYVDSFLFPDFVDFNNGKFCAGVVAFVSVNVISLGLHREDVGYATTQSPQKGSAIYNARKVITISPYTTVLSFIVIFIILLLGVGN